MYKLISRQERERAAKAAGKPLVVQKKFKVIEDHFDDCGEDVSKLGNVEDSVLFTSPNWDQDADPTVELSSALCMIDKLEQCWLASMSCSPGREQHEDVASMIRVLDEHGPGFDISLLQMSDSHCTFHVRRQLAEDHIVDASTRFAVSDWEASQRCADFHNDNCVYAAVMIPDALAPTLCEDVSWLFGQIAQTQLEYKYDFLVIDNDKCQSFMHHPWPSLFTNCSLLTKFQSNLVLVSSSHFLIDCHVHTSPASFKSVQSIVDELGCSLTHSYMTRELSYVLRNAKYKQEIDISAIPKAQPYEGEKPPEPDPRAPPQSESTCPGCRGRRKNHGLEA